MRNLESQSVNTGFVPQQATLSIRLPLPMFPSKILLIMVAGVQMLLISPVGNVQDVVRQHSVADVKVVDFLRINFQK